MSTSNNEAEIVLEIFIFVTLTKHRFLLFKLRLIRMTNINSTNYYTKHSSIKIKMKR